MTAAGIAPVAASCPSTLIIPPPVFRRLLLISALKVSIDKPRLFQSTVDSGKTVTDTAACFFICLEKVLSKQNGFWVQPIAGQTPATCGKWQAG